uniref:Lipocalin n=1 Tax=Rhipicephalus zambeziensis TaxID=60191 RepID=A0A224YB23_9ACAR
MEVGFFLTRRLLRGASLVQSALGSGVFERFGDTGNKGAAMSIATKALLLLVVAAMLESSYSQENEWGVLKECYSVQNQKEFDWNKFVKHEWMIALDQMGGDKYTMMGCRAFTFYPKDKGHWLIREYSPDKKDPYYTKKENATFKDGIFHVVEDFDCHVCDDLQRVEILGTDYDNWAVVRHCREDTGISEAYEWFHILLKKKFINSVPSGIEEKALKALKKKGIRNVKDVKFWPTPCVLQQ